MNQLDVRLFINSVFVKVMLSRWSTWGPARGSKRVPVGDPREEILAAVLCGPAAGLGIKTRTHHSTAEKHTEVFCACVHTGIFRKENENLRKHVYSVWFVRTGARMPSGAKNGARRG